MLSRIRNLFKKKAEPVNQSEKPAPTYIKNVKMDEATEAYNIPLSAGNVTSGKELQYEQWLDMSQPEINRFYKTNASVNLINPNSQAYADAVKSGKLKVNSFFGAAPPIGGVDNAVVGQGTFADISSYDTHKSVGYTEQTFWTTFYRTSPIANRAIKLLTNFCIGSGIDLLIEKDKDRIQVEKYLRKVNFQSILYRATKQMLEHGGCAIFIDEADANNTFPLNLKDPSFKKNFSGLRLIDKSLMYPSAFFTGGASGFSFASPQSWSIIQGSFTDSPNLDGANAGRNYNIDRSRFVFFNLERLPFFSRLNTLFWADPILLPLKRMIDITDRAFQSSGNMISQSSLKWLHVDLKTHGNNPSYINNLNSQFNQKLGLRLNQNSQYNILDKDDKVSSFEVGNFKGQAEEKQQLLSYITGNLGIPLQRFLGDSPEGFGTGSSESQQLYEEMLINRDVWLREPTRKLLDVIEVQTGIEIPDFAFKDFKSTTEEQEASVRLKNAQFYAIMDSMDVDREVIFREMKANKDIVETSQEDFAENAKEAQKKKDEDRKLQIKVAKASNLEVKDINDDKNVVKDPESATKKAISTEKKGG